MYGEQLKLKTLTLGLAGSAPYDFVVGGGMLFLNWKLECIECKGLN